MSLRGQRCGIIRPPEGAWLSPWLCVSRHTSQGWRDSSQGNELLRSEQGGEAEWMSAACRELGTGVGHCRTACGGDNLGPCKAETLQQI